MYNNVLIINVLIITRGKSIGGYGFWKRPKLQQEITLHRVYVLYKGTAFDYASFIFRNKYIYIYVCRIWGQRLRRMDVGQHAVTV